MKSRYFCGLLIVLLVPTVALAADPIPGIYNTPSLGGVVLEGRGSNSWTQPANGAQGLGDVFNAMSWDGSTLGTEWTFSCGVSPAVQVVQDLRDANGTGVVIFTTTYEGGVFFLSKDGPWGDGVNDLTGTANTTVRITTLQYVNNVPVSARENINSSGHFDGSDCVLTFVISNAVGLGDTDCCTKPADYPGFLDPNCGPTRIYGSWGDVVDITMEINCQVPVESESWGRIKLLYQD